MNPNQLAKESPYIANDIAATRAAYDLTAITRDPLLAARVISRPPALQANNVTVSNIRLWDPEVLLRSYGQLQELRPYYSFTSVSVDRYLVERRLHPDDARAARAARLRPAGAGADLGEPAHHLHARLRRDRLGGQPGGLGRLARLPRPGRAAGLVRARRWPSPSRASTTGARHRLRPGQDQGPEVRLPGPGGDVYTPLRRQRRHPGRLVLSTRLAFAVALRQHQVLHHVGHHRRQPGHHQEQHQRRACRRPRRSSPSTATPTW